MTVEQISSPEFRTAIRDIFGKEWTPAFVRARWDGESDRSRDTWTALHELGLTDLFLGNDDSGAAPAELRLALAEEAARVLFPLPLVETFVIIGPALAHSKHSAAEDWLARVSAGTAFAALMLDDRRPVDEAEAADFVLAVRDDDFVLVEREHCRIRPVTHQDRACNSYRVEFDPEHSHRLGANPQVIEDARTAMVRITAARLLGVAEVLFDRTVSYVGDRHQFGQPIGAFQSVQHRLADVFVALELARALVYEPSSAPNASRRPSWVSAAAAKVQAATAARLANREALQLHGAMGFSWEYDLHFWLKHGKALEQEYGTVSAHIEALAEFSLEATRADSTKEDT